MASFSWPSNGEQIALYSTFSAFPVTGVGANALAIAQDTGALYEFLSGSWVLLGFPGDTVTTIGTLDSEATPSANGATINADQLILQSASGTAPGLVNTATQTFAGSKTFSSAVSMPSNSTVASSVAGYSQFNIVNTNTSYQARLNLWIGSNGSSGEAAVEYAPGDFFALGVFGNDTTTPINFYTNNTTLQGSCSAAGLWTLGASSGTQTHAVNGNISITGNATVGSTGLLIKGSSSGTVSILPGAAAAGTYNFNLPTTAGTSGYALVSGGGGSSPMTWVALTTGTVTAVSIASSNGFAGSSSGGATPALTLSTTVNSPILAGNGTAIEAATTTGSGSTAVLSAAPAITGAWTLTDAGSIINASTTSKILAFSLSGMSASTTLTLASAQSTNQTLTIPNISASDTVATLGLAQTFSGALTLSAAGAALTVNNNAQVSGELTMGSSSGVSASVSGYSQFFITNTNTSYQSRLNFWIGSSGGSGQAAVEYAPSLFFALGIFGNDTTTPINFYTNNATLQGSCSAAGLWTLGASSGTQTHVVNGSLKVTVGIDSSAAQSTLTGSAGTAICSQPHQGASYKKVVIYLSGYTDTGTQTYTFPTAFSHTPYVFGLTAGVTGASATTTTVTFTVTTQTGFVFLEGY